MIVLLWLFTVIVSVAALVMLVRIITAAASGPLRRRFGYDYRTIAMIVVVGVMIVVFAVLIIVKLVTS